MIKSIIRFFKRIFRKEENSLHEKILAFSQAEMEAKERLIAFLRITDEMMISIEKNGANLQSKSPT